MPCTIAPDDVLPNPEWLIPDQLWEKVQPLLPPEKPPGSNGRPAVSQRRTMDAIFYILRTGAQWKALPRSLGSGSSAHRYFQEWSSLGVFEKLWRLSLEDYDVTKGIKWEWQCLDGAINKAPLAERRLVPIRRIGASVARNVKS